MRNLDQTTITESALERLAKCPDPRLKEVMTALIRHVHEFAREVKLTPAEWTRGIEFLTDVGHITDDKRQEFILLSDTLGLSALVDILANSGKSEATTESSLLGRFFAKARPNCPTAPISRAGLRASRCGFMAVSHRWRGSRSAARKLMYGRPRRAGCTTCNSTILRARR